VIEATDRALGRRVAIKIWLLQRRDGDRRDKRKQALAESKKLAALKHEGIVTVHRFIPGDTFVALDMEFLEGQTLREWLKPRSTDSRPGRTPNRMISP
jgi:serine/threonine protein kinase